MSLWGHLFAAGYDSMLRRAEQAGLTARRPALLVQARGSVVEIGAGTGLNLAAYPESLDRLVLSEPERRMSRRLERRLADLGRRAEITKPSAL
jgi:protein-L-isoaspartate O-methyltransferase